MKTLALFGLLGQILAHGPNGNHRCGTMEMDTDGIMAQRRAMSLFRLSNEPIVIPVCFHIVRRPGGLGDISRKALQRQLNHLNEAFSSQSCCDLSLSWCSPGDCSVDTSISFTMAMIDDNGEYTPGNTTDDAADANACVTRTANERWASGEGEVEMKMATRKGGRNVLNAWFVDVDYLGYAYYPWTEASIGNGGVLDGVVVRYGTVPGGALPFFNEGDTIVHETGHWLGLSHSFSDSCGRSDGISDTTPHTLPNTGCNPYERQDSCPGEGLDPIFNFMNYADDSCMYEFTQGQREIMRATWQVYRAGVTQSFTRQPLELNLGNVSAPLYMVFNERQVYQVDVTGVEGEIKCTSSGTSEGNADLYLEVGEMPSFTNRDSCAKTDTTVSSESCCATIAESKESSDNVLENLWNFFFSLFTPQSECVEIEPTDFLFVGVRAASDSSAVTELVVECLVEE